MRAVGIDLGTRRIGVAVSDSDGRLATPYEVIERSRDLHGDRRRLVELVREAEAEVVVVGIPYSLDGSEGPAARRARIEVEALSRVMPVPVETYDERLSTVTAHRTLQDLGLGSHERRRVVDKVAASVILQAWLDSRAAAALDDRPHTDDRTPRDPGEDPHT